MGRGSDPARCFIPVPGLSGSITTLTGLVQATGVQRSFEVWCSQIANDVAAEQR